MRHTHATDSHVTFARIKASNKWSLVTTHAPPSLSLSLCIFCLKKKKWACATLKIGKKFDVLRWKKREFNLQPIKFYHYEISILAFCRRRGLHNVYNTLESFRAESYNSSLSLIHTLTYLTRNQNYIHVMVVCVKSVNEHVCVCVCEKRIHLRECTYVLFYGVIVCLSACVSVCVHPCMCVSIFVCVWCVNMHAIRYRVIIIFVFRAKR